MTKTNFRYYELPVLEEKTFEEYFSSSKNMMVRATLMTCELLILSTASINASENKFFQHFVTVHLISDFDKFDQQALVKKTVWTGHTTDWESFERDINDSIKNHVIQSVMES